MLKIAIIIGSTRPGRNGEAVGRWVHELASQRDDATYELVDLKEINLPMLDEPVPAVMGKYTQPHTLAWAAKVAEFDGFVMVTPEYNHGPPAALKNALDYLFKEWNNKSVGFVGYGGAGGARSVDQMREIVSNLELADVRTAVGLTLAHDFENFSTFKPGAHQPGALNEMLNQVVAWAGALKHLRNAG
ncbi:MAG: NAD(P)H-dependent oxidoreductase [Gammaproteobacteria bacterium]|nr:NAD(P)H-dependent oxidoreductase [Gammaproteobacteria bacterium]